MRAYDSQGRPLLLDAELGRGGEGSVFGITGRPKEVAKLYHASVDRERAAKLADMARLRNERLLRLAAWPLDTLHRQPGGPVAGLLMPRVVGCKPIHFLYGPKSRLAEFPDAGWAFLVHTAGNLARAFAAIHHEGHVIGDVNHGNLLVSAQATVTLIDCDSFQITANGRRYLCEVGVSTHQPPELQERGSFRGVVRTPNHDHFGLAILLFQLLFMGRHPFSGRYLGSGDMPIEHAIREFRFAYGQTAPARQMQQPPGTLPLHAVSPPVAILFERAFSPDGVREGGRPTALEWVPTLDGLTKQLARCHTQPQHVFWNGLSACPWCSIEAQSGVVLFGVAVAAWPVQGTFDLTAVWAAIVAVPAPGAAISLPSFQTTLLARLPLQAFAPGLAAALPSFQSPRTPSPEVREHTDVRAMGPPSFQSTRTAAPELVRRPGATRQVRVACAVGIGILGVVAWLSGFPITGGAAVWSFLAALLAAWVVASWDTEEARGEVERVAKAGPPRATRPAIYGPLYREVERAVKAARVRWEAIEARWQSEASDRPFQEKLQELERTRHQYQELPALRRKKLQQLEAERRNRQLMCYVLIG